MSRTAPLRGQALSSLPGPRQRVSDSCPPAGTAPRCPAVPTRGDRAPRSPRGGTDDLLGHVSLPSAAELAAPARSSVSWHTISSTCASRSSLSRAYISRHRRGPKVPSFCKARPNRGPQGQSSPPTPQPPCCGKTPLEVGPTAHPRASLPRTSPATVPRPLSSPAAGGCSC